MLFDKILLCLTCLSFTFLNVFGQTTVPRGEHRIGIKPSGGSASFFDKETGETFVPRGFNYIQLVQSPAGPYGESQLFQPDSHSPEDIDDDFQRIAALGYNSLRVFLDLCRDERCIADQNGLIDEYVDNIVNLLERARQYNLFVMLTMNWLPDLGDYSGPAHEICGLSGDFFGGNCLVLSPKGVELYVTFFQDLIRALQDRNAPFDAIWSYQLRNEFFVEHHHAPFTKNSGMITAANGKSYDMGSAQDKKLLGEEGLVYWANTITSAIKALDPTALVTCGFFTPNDPIQLRENDTRIVPFRAALEQSELDFFDIHMYPGFDRQVDNLENYGLIGYSAKPIVLGEYGTFLPLTTDDYNAAFISDVWQSNACQAGIDGFLYWTWERHRTAASNNDDPWGGADEDAFLGKALSPFFKPDPCEVVTSETNVALGKNTAASMSIPENPSDWVVDGNPTQTPWISGGFPPQWVEVDFGRQYDLQKIELVVETGSDDPHHYTHQIMARSSPGAANRNIHTFSGDRVNFEQLSYQEPAGLINNVRVLRITMPEAPGWIALHELRAIVPADRDHLDVPAPPILSYPRPGLENITASKSNLEWKSDIEASASQLQIAVDSAFQEILVDEVINELNFDGNDLLSEEVFFWRVRQQNAKGWGPWSVVGKVRPGVIVSTADQRKELIKFYPNPAEEQITIENLGDNQNGLKYELLSSTGDRLKVITNPLPTQTITLGSLPSGVYFLRVYLKDGVWSGRIVKI